MDDPGEEASSFFGWLGRNLGTAILAIVFCVVFGFMGSLTAPGVGALLGAILGLLVGGIIGFFACGSYREMIKAADDAVDAQHFVPESMHESLFGHRRFTLYVTVHELKNSTHSELFGEPDFFIKVRCGRNPPKTTCVRGNGTWNETFKLMIEAQDTAVSFDVIDQNLLLDTKVGSVAVPIKEVFEQFNQAPKKYKMKSKSKPLGELMVSFRPGQDLSETHGVPQTECVQDTTVGGGGHYGTFVGRGRNPYFNTQLLPPPVPTAGPGPMGSGGYGPPGTGPGSRV